MITVDMRVAAVKQLHISLRYSERCQGGTWKPSQRRTTNPPLSTEYAVQNMILYLLEACTTHTVIPRVRG